MSLSETILLALPTGCFVSNVRHNSARATWTAAPGQDFQVAISTQHGI